MPLFSSAKKRQPEWAENELWGCFFLALLLLTVPLKLLTAAAVAAGFHELCHICAVRALGGRVEGAAFTVGGAVLDISGLSSGAEALAAAAGPLGSFLLLLCVRIFPALALCAFVQGCFNLLPVYPLDGGRILVCTMEQLGYGAWSGKVSNLAAWITLIGIAVLFLWLRMPLAIAFLLPLIPGKYSLQSGQTKSTIVLPITKR